MLNDRPSLPERYTRAANSSHLEVTIRPGDVDILIAAGLVDETLATRLIRLRGEFDSVRNGGLAIADMRAGIRVLVPTLKSYPATRDFLFAWASNEGDRSGVTPEEAIDVAARVLDLFLDPTCPSCDGRSFTGGHGLPTIRCTDCRETGRRRAWFASERQETFARWLQTAIDVKMQRAIADMHRLLRQHA